MVYPVLKSAQSPGYRTQRPGNVLKLCDNLRVVERCNVHSHPEDYKEGLALAMDLVIHVDIVYVYGWHDFHSLHCSRMPLLRKAEIFQRLVPDLDQLYFRGNPGLC